MPVKVLDNTDKLTNQFKAMYQGAEDVPDWKSGIAEWNKIKQSLAVKDPSFAATVPLETEPGVVPRFKTKEELESLIASGKFGDEYVVKEQSASGEWYAARPADLEDVASPYAEL